VFLQLFIDLIVQFITYEGVQLNEKTKPTIKNVTLYFAGYGSCHDHSDVPGFPGAEYKSSECKH
jgi:hypothetical protein